MSPKTTNKGWTPERREAQRQRCLENPPSNYATGPKTASGKARASMNAFKHGGDALYKKIAMDMLRHNQEFLKSAGAFAEIELIKAMQKQATIRRRTKG